MSFGLCRGRRSRLAGRPPTRSSCRTIAAAATSGGVPGRRRVEGPRPGQPQRHQRRRRPDPGRPHAGAGGHHPHRPLAAEVRPRSGQGLSRVVRRHAGPDAEGKNGDAGRRSGGDDHPGAHDDHASPRADEVLQAAGAGGSGRHSQGRPRRRQALPPGLRAGQEPGREDRRGAGAGRRVRGGGRRRRRRAAAAARLQQGAQGHGAGDVASRSTTKLAVLSDLAVPGRHRAARRRSRAGPQRDGRQQRSAAATAKERSTPRA